MEDVLLAAALIGGLYGWFEGVFDRLSHHGLCTCIVAKGIQ